MISKQRWTGLGRVLKHDLPAGFPEQCRDSIAQYEKAGRTELAEQEAFEIEVLQEYLPQALSEEEIASLVAEAIADSGAESIRDMGKVMGQLKPKMQGRADMGAVSALVKQQLGS